MQGGPCACSSPAPRATNGLNLSQMLWAEQSTLCAYKILGLKCPARDIRTPALCYLEREAL